MQDQADTEGGQQGFQGAAVKESDDATLYGDAEGTGNQKRRRYRHQQRILDGIGHGLLDQVGGVGADHDQFAMGHIDHAHNAEGDGKPDGGQGEHRSQAETEKQRLDGAVHLQFEIDAVEYRFRGGEDLRVVRFLLQTGEGVACLGFQIAVQLFDGASNDFRITALQFGHGDCQGECCCDLGVFLRLQF